MTDKKTDGVSPTFAGDRFTMVLGDPVIMKYGSLLGTSLMVSPPRCFWEVPG